MSKYCSAFFSPPSSISMRSPKIAQSTHNLFFPFMRKKTECYVPMLITVHGMSQRIALNLSFYFLAINGMPFVSRTSDKIGPEGRNFGYILTISYLSRYLTYQRNFMNFIKFKCCFLDWSLKVFISH